MKIMIILLSLILAQGASAAMQCKGASVSHSPNLDFKVVDSKGIQLFHGEAEECAKLACIAGTVLVQGPSNNSAALNRACKEIAGEENIKAIEEESWSAGGSDSSGHYSDQ